MSLLHLVFVAVYALTVASQECNLTADVFFEVFDTNHDGKITVQETDKLFQFVDFEGSGGIDGLEFAIYMIARHSQYENCADTIFRFLDCNVDGVLSDFDLGEIDKNGDNIITPDEFSKYRSQ